MGQRCTCAQALLLNSTDQKLFEEKLNIRCEEVQIAQAALKKLEKAIAKTKKCSCGKRGFKYFVIEATDPLKAKQELSILPNKIK